MRILRGVAVFFGAMLLQWWWSSHLGRPGASPQFLLALTILLAARRGPVLAMLAGFGWGLYLDLARAELFGAGALTLVLAAYAASLARRQIDLRAAAPLALLTCLLSAAALLLEGALGLVFVSRFQWAGWLALLVVPILNAAVAAVLAAAWDAGGPR
ncbi:MAG: rod shape-determining protein MreD [Elusimicrobia bacterium]|nr:rod shape-determining protein MreD [Elusimicrobiota bacterium]